ncbi:golgi reassembly stacking protein [Aureococcus anophagefferens]|uniref:Golgi reassembly stacking protein n=1 Tax=Aureococcus anophagefferens TaxID=44056 RepID=A0ABR1FGH4_AURAN|nr:hypothetical protein JL721_2071 [Aureococcus anophagefferens]
MGQGASAEEADATGYRVLGVQPNSPASDVGLVSFFDFVVAVDGSEDRPLPCVVYNLKSRQTRSVTITPTRNWGGQGMLGVTIRFDTYHKADEHLVRVLEVAPGSPAEIAGLRAGTDYLLGTAERVLNDECTLHLDKPVEFYVYNTETDEVRVVVLLPTYSWGGGGCLGAAVAHGYLHRLPARCRESNGVSIEPERPVAPNARDAMAVDAPPPPPPPADVPPPQTEVPVA